jgi:hypothetical protein
MLIAVELKWFTDNSSANFSSSEISLFEYSLKNFSSLQIYFAG